ncbi:hypothetical protein P5673_027936 [Acropora cervicornis]|uniref:Folate receptor-like domain-containing protein n=1 Tax=Acropora cervicornis TaxID=6130 RepID=A0AAD9PY14_ACRCE|nr:hypothetical protein P5673_027936 [Acropora cervicornis]
MWAFLSSRAQHNDRFAHITALTECRKKLTASPTVPGSGNVPAAHELSPDQHQWLRRGKVHVCKSFCNDVYKHCKDAKFEGKALSSVYSSGNEFCKAQHFNVLDEDTQACYKFDDSLFATASLHKGCSFRVILLLVVSLIYHFLWT